MHWGVMGCTGCSGLGTGCSGKHWKALGAVGWGPGPGWGSVFRSGVHISGQVLGPRLGVQVLDWGLHPRWGSGSWIGVWVLNEGLGPRVGSGFWVGVWLLDWGLGRRLGVWVACGGSGSWVGVWVPGWLSELHVGVWVLGWGLSPGLRSECQRGVWVLGGGSGSLAGG